MRIPRIASLAFLVLLLLTTITAAMPERPTTDIYVQDNAELLSTDTKNHILTIGHELNEKTTAQIVVVTVKNLDDKPIADYANELFRSWGIGDKEKNNGVLLLISQNPRKLRIEVGYGLEGAIPDGYTGRIRDEDLTPHLKKNDYDTGVALAYEKLAAKAAAEYDQSLDSISSDAQKFARDNDDGFFSFHFSTEFLVEFWAAVGSILFFALIILYQHFFGSHENTANVNSANNLPNKKHKGHHAKKSGGISGGYYDSGGGGSGGGDSFGGGDSGGGGSDGDY